MTRKLDLLKELIASEIKEQEYGTDPVELYEPIQYIMALGGKRLRPLLTLIAYSLYKNKPEKIIRQALAMEVFHNFTLMHDDIMDEAPLRRGQPTVHEKWNKNTAILSGDVMLVKAYDLMLETDEKYLQASLKLFNKCASEVCEGQQMDMLFECRESVSETEYLDMIRLKTAVLLGTSLRMGALLAGANKVNQKSLYSFGVNIGMGFQLKDDLLDVYADKEKFGKQVGGDIIANKKTFLLIKAQELANTQQQQELNQWLCAQDFDGEEKVAAVTKLYDQLDIKALAEQKMNDYFNASFSALKKVDAPLQKRSVLREFAESLIVRES